MKKYVSLAMTLVLTLSMLFAMVVPASAEITDTFVDEIPADTANFKSEVVEFSSVGEDPNNSHKIAVENNPDLGKTLLLKTAAPRDAKHTEYIIYKMDKDICGFKLDVVCCAGLGHPLEDITVYLSKNGTDWNQINTQATKYTYDEDIYINFDKAYWHQSTITNKKAFKPDGFRYIKIQFNGCNEANDVPWNIAVDKITVYMGSKTNPPTISAEDKFETYEQINSTKTTKPTGGATTPTGGNDSKPTEGNDSKPTEGNDSKQTNGNDAKPTNGGNDSKQTNGNDATPTDGNNVVTPTGDATTPSGDISGDTTGGEAADPSATADDGSIADPSATADDGSIADPSAPVDGGEDQDVAGEQGDGEKSNAWIWWVIGAIVVLGGAGAGVFFYLKKKKA